MELNNRLTKNRFLLIMFFLSFFCVGCFHEISSCILTIMLFGWLTHKAYIEKKLIIKKNLTMISMIVICSFYGISIVWAIDSGMAVLGFFKYLPVLLFMLCAMQETDFVERIENGFPYVMCIMTLISFVGMYIPAVSSVFSVAGRLAGFLQYPNTFAVILLTAEIMILGKREKKKQDYIILAVLIIGLLYTGSRTVFVLAVFANGCSILKRGNKKIRIAGLGGVLLSVAVLIFHSGLQERLLNISVTESTFLGRILYFKDAVPLVWKYPFGTGYMGYYYLQQSVQTGVYSVRYIHNDLLQMLLDIGWIPVVLFIAAIIKTLAGKTISFERKLILCVLFLHSCFDFNFQFLSVFCLFVLLLDWNTGKTLAIKIPSVAFKIFIVFCLTLNLYIGISLFTMHIGKYELSAVLYPWNTENNKLRLINMEDMEEMAYIAAEITEQNEYEVLAYSTLSKYFYSKGDFTSVIQYKNYIFQIAPFQYEEYVDYMYMLANGYSLYLESNDLNSASVCKEELLKTKERINELEKRLSTLGKKIKDQPVTVIPDDLELFIKQLK